MKKLLSMLLVLTLTLSVCVIGAVAETADPTKIYVVSVMSGGAAWGRFEEGFMETCDKYGWEGHYLAPATANDATIMVQLAETALNDGADVLAVCITEPDLFREVLERANAQGVTVLGIAAGVEDLCKALVGTDALQLGQNTAETLVKLAGDGPINVAVGQTLLSMSLQNEQIQAFIDKLSELRPDAVIVDRFEMNSVASTAADKLSALYVAHPELNAVVSFDSYVGVGAASFVADYGIQDKFLALGIDDGAEVLLCVKDGTLDGTIAQQWYDIGIRVVDVANQILAGKEVEYSQGVPTVAILPEDVDAYAEANGISLN